MVVSHFHFPVPLGSLVLLSDMWKNKLEPDKLMICDITSAGDLIKSFNFSIAVSMETLKTDRQTDTRMAHFSSYKQTKGNEYRTEITVNLRAVKTCLPATVYISQHNI